MSGLEVRGLVHRHPGFTLGPVALAVAAGSVHALLGPNGSGKTTLLEVLARTPGHPAFVPADETSIPLELTGTELWDVCAVLQGRRTGRTGALRHRADELARALALHPVPSRPLAELSHGMRTKARLVAALLSDPHVILLDEPNGGLDPLAGHRLGTTLREAADRGAAILVATHDLAWAHQFADRATVLAAGRIVASGATEHVLGPVGEGSLLERFLATVPS